MMKRKFVLLTMVLLSYCFIQINKHGISFHHSNARHITKKIKDKKDSNVYITSNGSDNINTDDWYKSIINKQRKINNLHHNTSKVIIRNGDGVNELSYGYTVQYSGYNKSGKYVNNLKENVDGTTPMNFNLGSNNDLSVSNVGEFIPTNDIFNIKVHINTLDQSNTSVHLLQSQQDLIRLQEIFSSYKKNYVYYSIEATGILTCPSIKLYANYIDKDSGKLKKYLVGEYGVYNFYNTSGNWALPLIETLAPIIAGMAFAHIIGGILTLRNLLNDSQFISRIFGFNNLSEELEMNTLSINNSYPNKDNAIDDDGNIKDNNQVDQCETSFTHSDFNNENHINHDEKNSIRINAHQTFDDISLNNEQPMFHEEFDVNETYEFNKSFNFNRYNNVTNFNIVEDPEIINDIKLNSGLNKKLKYNENNNDYNFNDDDDFEINNQDDDNDNNDTLDDEELNDENLSDQESVSDGSDNEGSDGENSDDNNSDSDYSDNEESFDTELGYWYSVEDEVIENEYDEIYDWDEIKSRFYSLNLDSHESKMSEEYVEEEYDQLILDLLVETYSSKPSISVDTKDSLGKKDDPEMLYKSLPQVPSYNVGQFGSRDILDSEISESLLTKIKNDDTFYMFWLDRKSTDFNNMILDYHTKQDWGGDSSIYCDYYLEKYQDHILKKITTEERQKTQEEYFNYFLNAISHYKHEDDKPFKIYYEELYEKEGVDGVRQAIIKDCKMYNTYNINDNIIPEDDLDVCAARIYNGEKYNIRNWLFNEYALYKAHFERKFIEDTLYIGANNSEWDDYICKECYDDITTRQLIENTFFDRDSNSNYNAGDVLLMCIISQEIQSYIKIDDFEEFIKNENEDMNIKINEECSYNAEYVKQLLKSYKSIYYKYEFYSNENLDYLIKESPIIIFNEILEMYSAKYGIPFGINNDYFCIRNYIISDSKILEIQNLSLMISIKNIMLWNIGDFQNIDISFFNICKENINELLSSKDIYLSKLDLHIKNSILGTSTDVSAQEIFIRLLNDSKINDLLKNNLRNSTIFLNYNFLTLVFVNELENNFKIIYNFHSIKSPCVTDNLEEAIITKHTSWSIDYTIEDKLLNHFKGHPFYTTENSIGDIFLFSFVSQELKSLFQENSSFDTIYFDNEIIEKQLNNSRLLYNDNQNIYNSYNYYRWYLLSEFKKAILCSNLTDEEISLILNTEYPLKEFCTKLKQFVNNIDEYIQMIFSGKDSILNRCNNKNIMAIFFETLIYNYKFLSWEDESIDEENILLLESFNKIKARVENNDIFIFMKEFMGNNYNLGEFTFSDLKDRLIKYHNNNFFNKKIFEFEEHNSVLLMMDIFLVNFNEEYANFLTDGKPNLSIEKQDIIDAKNYINNKTLIKLICTELSFWYSNENLNYILFEASDDYIISNDNIPLPQHPATSTHNFWHDPKFYRENLLFNFRNTINKSEYIKKICLEILNNDYPTTKNVETNFKPYNSTLLSDHKHIVHNSGNIYDFKLFNISSDPKTMILNEIISHIMVFNLCTLITKSSRDILPVVVEISKSSRPILFKLYNVLKIYSKNLSELKSSLQLLYNSDKTLTELWYLETISKQMLNFLRNPDDFMYFNEYIKLTSYIRNFKSSQEFYSLLFACFDYNFWNLIISRPIM